MLYNIVLQYSILYSFSWLCSCLADLSRVSVVRRGLCWWELTTRTWKRVLVPCLGGFLHLTFPWRWCWLNLSQSTYYSLIRIHLHIYIYVCTYTYTYIDACQSGNGLAYVFSSPGSLQEHGGLVLSLLWQCSLWESGWRSWYEGEGDRESPCGLAWTELLDVIGWGKYTTGCFQIHK